jgi:MinD superfamily P-loop ATPase
MKEIVIISGKGGTGKTSISASYAMLLKDQAIIGDCDVDAADMHLLLSPDFANSENFYSGELAEIDTEKCINCGICNDICRFDAISARNAIHKIDPISCEGCGYCARVCASKAITNKASMVGHTYVSSIKSNSTMVHAKLKIGADNSGKLVAEVKNKAKEIARKKSKAFLIIDGSPGVGCPVVSSLSGADFVVLVTEPSVSGFHDLQRVFELVDKFHIRAGCIINKFDINTDISKQIEHFLKEKQIIHLANIPYTLAFTKSMIEGKTIVESGDQKLLALIEKSWETIKNNL